MPFNFTVTTDGYPVPTLSKTGTLPAGVTFTDNGDGTAHRRHAGQICRGYLRSYSQGRLICRHGYAGVQSTITLAPTINKIPTKTAHVGNSFNMTIDTSDGYTTPALTESGLLPNGLTFVDNGNGQATLSGTPNVGSGGSYAVTVTATNALGSSSQTFTLKVDEGPVITSASSATATQAQPFNFQVTATGYPAPRLTKLGSLPRGLTWKASTGTISGTPASRYRRHVQLRDYS